VIKNDIFGPQKKYVAKNLPIILKQKGSKSRYK